MLCMEKKLMRSCLLKNQLLYEKCHVIRTELSNNDGSAIYEEN